jgi:hypothetical protein
LVESSDGNHAAQRRALLSRTVADLTREWRASVRSAEGFEVVLARGRAVHHRVHRTAFLSLLALAVLVGFSLGGAPTDFATTLWVPALYLLFWLYLAVTGGEQFERLFVDERGKLHSTKWGRSPETRGDFWRVAAPLAVILLTGSWTVGLVHDLAFPPPPRCNVPEAYWPDSCFTLPSLSGGNAATYEPGILSQGTTATVQSNPYLGALNVDDTRTLERYVRVYLLAATLAFLLPALWFLARMLTGRYVAFIRPVRGRVDE